jgi:hypothetical protein
LMEDDVGVTLKLYMFASNISMETCEVLKMVFFHS